MESETTLLGADGSHETENDSLLQREKKRSIHEENHGRNESKLVFYVLTAMIEVVGITCLVLVAIWGVHYRGGFAWDGSFKEFNYHPLFMVTGLVVLYGNGMIVYRVFKDMEKMYAKVVHATFLGLSLLFSILGLMAVFDFHNMNTQPDGSHMPIPNMYSLHSWLGIAVVVLFACQYLFGFLSFLWPKFNDSIRAQYLKVHVYFGIAIFVGSVGACLTGFTEKLLFSIMPIYSKFVSEGLLVNVLGLMLVLFSGLIVFLATHAPFKRPPEGSNRDFHAVS